MNRWVGMSELAWHASYACRLPLYNHTWYFPLVLPWEAYEIWISRKHSTIVFEMLEQAKVNSISSYTYISSNWREQLLNERSFRSLATISPTWRATSHSSRVRALPPEFFIFYFSARVFGFLNVFFLSFFDVLVIHLSPLAFRSIFLFFLFERKNPFPFFSFHESHSFAFARDTVLLSRESRPCLSKTKKMRFLFFFASHGFASVRGMVVL